MNNDIGVKQMKEVFNIFVLVLCIGVLIAVFKIPSNYYSFDHIIKEDEKKDFNVSKNTEEVSNSTETGKSELDSLITLLDNKYNGEYKNELNNGKYILLSRNNDDDTFSIIFVDTGEFEGVSEIIYPVNVKGATINDDNVIYFEDSELAVDPLKLFMSEDGVIIIQEGSNLDHPEFVGSYVRVRSIPEADITYFKAM